MEIPEGLRCIFSAEVDEQQDSYVIGVPKNEVETRNIQKGRVYRTALLTTTETEAEEGSSDSGAKADTTGSKQGVSGPPVGEGEVREVEIENIGDQGDGITRVERGFVVIVPETEKGERVTVEITDVKPNVAFGEVKERQTHI
jgi:predicted RNA-binding protein with TRAM domain